MQDTNSSRDLKLFDLLTLYVCMTGIAGLLLLVLNKFDSLYSLIIGAFFTVLTVKIFKCRMSFRDERFDLYLLLILLIAGFFIAKPYLYIMGGQDEGIYVNMSSTYEKTGSTFIKDNLREALPEDEKEIYDAYNHYGLTGKVEDKYEGSNEPGVFIKDLEKSEYVYQFYPLHPIWMAIFGKVLGEDNRVYSLFFFSILSLVTFFLLAYELSNRKKWPAYIIAGFLALNPLFTFFSKFPVSEIVSIAMSGLGFYYLLRYFQQYKENGSSQKIFLFLSSLAFFNLFFNHISGFLYMPIFYLFLLIAMLFIDDKSRLRIFVLYALSIFFWYFLSVLYGLKYSFPYSFDIYNFELSRLILFNWKLQLLLTVILLAAILYVVRHFRMYVKNLIAKYLPYTLNILVLLIILIIPLNIYDAYNAGIAFGDLKRVMLSSAIYITVLYLTPIGLILFLFGLNKARKLQEVPNFMFLIFLLLAWYMKIIISVWVGYQYYAARYLFNEVVVYSMLFIALYCGHLLTAEKFKKYFAIAAIAFISIYSIYYTSFQLQGQEADGSNRALKRIAAQIDEKDILMPTFSGHEILTPLKYYFGLNMFIISPQEVGEKDFFNYFLGNFNDIFVLSTKPLSNRNLEIIDIIAYKEGIFEHPGYKIPQEFFYHNQADLYLYKVNRYDYFTRHITIRPADYERTGFYEDNIWTNGEGVIKKLAIQVHPESKYVIIQANGSHPFKNDVSKIKLKLYINGQELKFEKQSNNNYYFLQDKGIKEINEIKINSATFIPADLGINADTRKLGLDVNFVKIE